MYYLRSTLLVLVFGVQVFSQVALPYPTTETRGMVGFATVGRVTGGWSGRIVIINNLAALQKYASGVTSRVLIITRNIIASTKTRVTFGSNKSIIGSFNQPILHNIYLQDDNNNKSGNIIIQNLVFQHDNNIKNDGDIQLFINYSKRYWIDHCTFMGHKWSNYDGSADKLLYVGGFADYVTISNCHFHDHKYGLIFGYPTDKNVSYPRYDVRLTLCNNHFENFDVRGPGLFRYGHYHVYNNYIRNSYLGFTVAKNGKVISENNYFEKYGNILNDFGNGQFTDKGSIPPIKTQKSPKSDWSASSQYRYTLKNAALIKRFLPTHVGAQSAQLTF